MIFWISVGLLRKKGNTAKGVGIANNARIPLIDPKAMRYNLGKEAGFSYVLPEIAFLVILVQKIICFFLLSFGLNTKYFVTAEKSSLKL